MLYHSAQHLNELSYSLFPHSSQAAAQALLWSRSFSLPVLCHRREGGVESEGEGAVGIKASLSFTRII